MSILSISLLHLVSSIVLTKLERADERKAGKEAVVLFYENLLMCSANTKLFMRGDLKICNVPSPSAQDLCKQEEPLSASINKDEREGLGDQMILRML